MQRRLNKEYFLGLNYLIENQPDKAIDAFVKLLEVGNETIDIHLTLGSLFRSRGEVDRAIRVHQNIIARPNLAHEERIHALSELGRDYLQAGVLDRAEKLFLEVVAQRGPYKHPCLEFLLCIYEQERDWSKAIATAKQLQLVQTKSMAKVIAQYYCELALGIVGNSPRDAIRSLNTALKINPRCVRANLLLGDIYTGMERYRLAIKHLQRVRDQDAAWLGETTKFLSVCYEAMGKEAQLIDYWEVCLQQTHNVVLVLEMAKSLRKHHGDRVSIEFLAKHMRDYPSMSTLSYLVSIYRDNSVGDALEKLFLLEGYIVDLIRKIMPYQCKQCGFSGAALYWQCPGCRGWEVMLPSHQSDAYSLGVPLEEVGAI